MTSTEIMQSALNAIGEEAEKLLSNSLPDNFREALERIVSIARYGMDVRTEGEQIAARK